MKSVRSGLWLLAVCGCLSCVRPPARGSYPVQAQLNEQRWFGNADAVKVHQTPDEPCAANTFILLVKTDLPHPDDRSKVASDTAGCLTACLPTQRISFYNVPLRRGKYRIARLDTCGTPYLKDPYLLLLYNTGSGVLKSYGPVKNSANWVRVTRFDQRTNIIEGKFKLTLRSRAKYGPTDSTPQTVRFRQGQYTIKLANALKLR